MTEMDMAGWYMPAEWEKHKATWLTWPHDEAHWPGKFEKIEPIFARMVKELSVGEDVNILVHDDEVRASVEKHLADVDRVRVFLHRVPNNFAWARDHGPIFVKNEKGDRRILNWKYNAWGNKYVYGLDDKIPAAVGEILNVPVVDVPMVLEGGSIDVNGKGTLLTTSSCLFNRNRNPQLSHEEIENNLQKFLGVGNVVWLENEIVGDDTNGHIDDMSRFVSERTIFTVVEKNEQDENFVCLKRNLELLKAARDQNGESFEIIEVPMPDPVVYEGNRLPASYSNFYIGNEAVLLPVYNCANDQIAEQALEKAFPERRIVPIDCTDLIWGLGAFHCLTQQEPL